MGVGLGAGGKYWLFLVVPWGGALGKGLVDENAGR